ncbi:MAG: hypothetical protein ABFS18_11560 [Thermodesulfobacteriota bacterium]
MGQARRRKMSGEMDLWFHGTNEFFSSWLLPAPVSAGNTGLLSHSFISLSKDRALAQGAGDIAGGLCSATLTKDARVLDLRKKSPDSMQHWELVSKTEMGGKHPLAANYNTWEKGCKSGEILILRTEDQQYEDELKKCEKIVKSTSGYTLQERQKAFLDVQNFPREWIESVIAPGKELGYDAVICSEIDRTRASGRKTCTNLYVFNTNVISAPSWIQKPDMLAYEMAIRELEKSDLYSTGSN